MKHIFMAVIAASVCATSLAQPRYGMDNIQRERLDRGVVAIRQDAGHVVVSWRTLYSDKKGESFDIYRNGVKLNAEPLTKGGTFFVDDKPIDGDATYEIRGGGRDGKFTLAANAPEGYLPIRLQKPADGTTPDGRTYSYSPNDASVGDVDGDGQYEIILKWSPSNERDNSHGGFTGNTLFDCYRLDGTRLWRIDMGPNIRGGSHYSAFMFYDFNGDGKAELICKTAPGTTDGQGHYVSEAADDENIRTTDNAADYRDSRGRPMSGPEYLTVFDGLTGRAIDTKEYIPTRYPLDGWGGVGGNGGNDSTGGRSDRFTTCVAFLDGKRPSPVMVRGWYGRTVLAAWTFDGDSLRSLWTFDSAEPGLERFSGMGNHNLAVADFDGDGCDEVCVGAMTVDHDGTGLYSTGLRHGDALHAGRLVAGRPGLQVFGVHENEGKRVEHLRTPAVAMFDGATGEILWQDAPGADAGRGVAADIDPRYPGAECWCSVGGLRRGDTGEVVSERKPEACSFIVYWDADPLSELLDHTTISKWNWREERTDTLLRAEGCVWTNGTKGNPCLSADLLGDWREEVVWPSADQKELRVYTTTIPAGSRRPSLMTDRQYRLAVAWQNVAYNQPPHLSFTLE